MNDMLKESGLSSEEIELTKHYVDDHDYNGIPFYETELYEKLFEFFCFETNEMPYGVAKARTGDPVHWILEHLEANNENR